VAANDDVVLAYTRAQDPLGFVGNRQALSSARSTSCAAGTCNFLASEMRDPNGRQIRVERPRVTFDGTGTVVIAFRGLGFGPDAFGNRALPGDSPGMTLGTGELGLVRIERFDQPRYTAQFVGLSNDGLQHWKPDVVYDESMGGIIAVSMQAVAPIGLRTAMQIAQQLSPDGSSVPNARDLGDGAALRMAMDGPDFELRNSRLSHAVIASGQVLRIEVDLSNIGSNYALANSGPLSVVASLNGPAGAAPALGRFDLTSTMASNSSRAVSITVTMPAGVANDQLQTVFLDVVASSDANAVDGKLDHATLELNDMPTPIRLNAAVRDGSPLVNLTWANPNDSRIYGWRVWKLDANGNWCHLGSTRKPGYVDLTGNIEIDQIYRVAAFSANGMESDPSESITTKINAILAEQIFRNGSLRRLRRP
jgi:hypothetical protein